MQTSLSRYDERRITVYGRGFFAFLCGVAIVGALLGTMCFCLNTEAAEGIALFGGELQSRMSMEHGRLMAGAFLGSTVFLLGIGLMGFCAVGQPFELALLALRGMGLGYSMAQLYAQAGREGAIYAAGLLLPGAAISTLGLIAATREAVSLSNIYLRLTLSDRQEQGLAEAVKLYGAKLLVIGSVLALAAGADTVCNYLFIEKLI